MNKPTVFVLMPFSQQFDDLYSHFIKNPLEKEGFDVKRADDIQSTRNILRDVFEGIANRDLIVADLTESNPNVFYELGIAHAFRKPTILLTQQIEETPFDLQGYRLIPYSRDFVEIEKSKQQLIDLAKEFLRGTLPAGSPIADFYPQSRSLGTTQNVMDQPESTTYADIDGQGLIDYQLQIQELIESLAPVISRATDAAKDVGFNIQNSASQLEEINESPNESTPRAIQNVCRRLAERVADFNSILRPANIEFSEITSKLSEALESMIALQIADFGSDPTEIHELIQQEVSVPLAEIAGVSTTILSFADVLEAVPRMERRLNRELRIATDEVRQMEGNVTRFLMLFGFQGENTD